MLLNHLGQLGRSQPVRVQPGQVVVSRPTGDRATLSDVDGDSVVDELCEELARWRNADAFDAVRGRAYRELDAVSGQRDRALLIRLDRAVRSQVQQQRRSRRISGPRCDQIEDLHNATL